MEDKPLILNKVGPDRYEFVTGTEDIDRREYVNGAYLKKHYAAQLSEKINHMNNLGKINRDLEQNRVEKDVELEHFIELANKAHKYKLMMDAQANQRGTLNILEMIDKGLKAIEKVLPEVKRMKK